MAASNHNGHRSLTGTRPGATLVFEMRRRQRSSRRARSEPPANERSTRSLTDPTNLAERHAGDPETRDIHARHPYWSSGNNRKPESNQGRVREPQGTGGRGRRRRIAGAEDG